MEAIRISIERKQLILRAIPSIKKHINWLLSMFVILGVSCDKPEQPPLTKKENVFLRGLESKFKAKAVREVDVMMLGRFHQKGKRGGYWVNLQISCDSLLLFDAEANQRKMDTVARQLFYDVLDSDRKYNLITIAFSCDTSSALYQSRVFDFGIDSLHRY
jgi:hypothetical protein